MAYCTDRREDVITCMGNYSCHTCPYWSRNIKNRDEDEDKRNKVNKASNKLTPTLNKAETCKNYNYWCGKLDHISNCDTCKFYKTE